MFYLIAIYLMVFVYLIFLLTVKEVMRRFYKEVKFDEECETEKKRKENSTDKDYLPNLCWNRHCADMQAALSYFFILWIDGRVGSASEREFISEERNRIRFRSKCKVIMTETYDDSDQESPLLN
jgi:hypothetical protein